MSKLKLDREEIANALTHGLGVLLAVGAGAFVMVASGAAMLGRAGFLDRRMARRSIRWPLRW